MDLKKLVDLQKLFFTCNATCGVLRAVQGTTVRSTDVTSDQLIGLWRVPCAMVAST